MELTIAINSYKNTDLLKLCLDSILKHMTDTSYEVIVADSETGEDTEIMMREDYPNIKFFPHKKNVGFQVLINKGIQESSGDYVLFLNSDILITPGSVDLMLDFMKNNNDTGLVGPSLLNFNGTFQSSCFRFYRPMTILYRRTFLKKFGFAKKHLDWFLMKDYDHLRPKEVDWIMGSAMMAPKRAINKVGLMDPRFFMYMEDVDWCRRFWEKGYKVVYFPEAKMHHYHGKGSAKGGFIKSILLNKLTWVHIMSGVKYFFKYWGKTLPKHN
jgi:hypothetical protein